MQPVLQPVRFPLPQGSTRVFQQNKPQLVVVPSPGDESFSKWATEQQSWLAYLFRELNGNIEILELLHSGERPSASIIQRSLSAGQYLVEALADLHSAANGGTQPILLCGYGFGGYTLLKALDIMRERVYQFKKLADLIVGVTFLGVPNVARNADKCYGTLELMVRSRNLGTKSLAAILPPQEAQDILELCKSFELLSLTIPVFCMYERRPTLIQKHRFGIRKTIEAVVVPKNLCHFNKRNETDIEVDADHQNIHKFLGATDEFRILSQKLTEILKSATQRLTTRDHVYNAPSELQRLTLRSETASERGNVVDIYGATNINLTPSSPAAEPSPAAGTIGSSIASYHVIPSTVPFEVLSSELSLPCFSMGVCQKKDNFFGRDACLQQIDKFLLPRNDNALDPGASSLRSFAICGLGGMGKTELAIEYAYTRRQHFEAIFWLGADNRTLLEAEFAQIAVRLGLEDPEDKNDLSATRELIKGWLAQPGRKTSNAIEGEEVAWLLIFDNVDDMDVLSDFWPTHGRGSVLITSRDPWAKSDVYTVKDGIDLPPFSTDETIQFMQQVTKIRAQGSSLTALTEIADRIQGLPMAIKYIAAMIREVRMSYADFLRLYDREGIQRVHEVLGRTRKARGHPQEDANENSLAIMWALDELSPSAKALLWIMSLMHPDSVPEYLISSQLELVDLPDYPRDPTEFYLARASLLKSSLISQNESSGTLSVHRLVQETAKTFIDSDKLSSVFRTAFTLVSSQWSFSELENTWDMSRHERCSQIFPTILKLKMGLEELYRQDSLCVLSHSVAKLLNNSGYLNERGNAMDSRDFFRFALTICERLAPALKETEDVQSIIRESHCFLGCTESDVYNYPAAMKHLKIWSQLAEERKDQTGAQVEDFELGLAYSEVGVVYADVELFDKAEEYFRASIEKMKRIENYEQNSLGWAQPNLGILLCVLGRFEEARVLLEEILAIFDDHYAGDDSQSYKKGKILFGLGNVFECLGQPSRSAEYYHKSLREYVKAVGVHHFRYGDVCFRLAEHYIQAKSYADADSFLKQAINIFRAKTYLERPLARALYRHSELLRLKVEEEEALKELKKAADLRNQWILYDNRPIEQLQAADFDRLVNWMSR